MAVVPRFFSPLTMGFVIDHAYLPKTLLMKLVKGDIYQYMYK